MRITTKGQVTIPLRIRRKLGLHPETEIEFDIEGDHALIRKARKSAGGRGKYLVGRLKGRGDVRMSTDAILALTRG
jgi:AbrB family looped-hinge helix DNA binding protein